jgi:hypothetical protein
MGKILISCFGVALLFAVAACSHKSDSDSMGSMKMNSDNSMSTPAPATMPAAAPMDTMK